MTGRKPHNPNKGQFGYAYLIRNPRSGFYKIGSARNPVSRCAAIAREMYAKCALVHTIATNSRERLERHLQGRFIASHIGGEWYELDDAEVASLQTVSTVFYHDSEFQPRSTLRADFDSSASWAKRLPVCGAYAI